MLDRVALDEEQWTCRTWKFHRYAQREPQQQLGGGVFEALHSKAGRFEVHGRAGCAVEMRKGCHRLQLVERPAR
jgi:hypothetical protein